MTDFKPQVETEEVTQTKTIRREYVSNATLLAALGLILFGLIGAWMTWVTTSILGTQDKFFTIQTQRTDVIGEWMKWRGQVDLKYDDLLSRSKENREKLDALDREFIQRK